MKKLMLVLLVTVLTVALISGCSSSEQQNSVLSHEKIWEYAKDQGINIITTTENEEEKSFILTYQKGSEYGFIKFYNDDSNDGTELIKNSIEIDENSDKVEYIQTSEGKNKYVTVFILDNELLKQAGDITIEFEDRIKGKPHKITIWEEQDLPKAVIFDYESDGFRRVKKIEIRDNQDNVIYPLPEI